MDKEEILAKSRREYQKKDIAEIEAMASARGIATWAGLIGCALLLVLDLLFREEMTAGYLVIGWGMVGATWLVKYIKLRRKKSELVAGIGSLVLCAAWFARYLQDLTGGF